MERVYNFAAGPAVMPEEALRRAAEEMLNYRGTGMSVMEMSHRSAAYQEIFDNTVSLLRRPWTTCLLRLVLPQTSKLRGLTA